MPQQNNTRSCRIWNRDEFILTLDLYFRIPFGRFSKTNPDIIKMANFIDRTPSSVAMRLCNYAACDPELQERGVLGLRAGKRQCEPYWNEFSSNLGDLHREAILSRERILSLTTLDDYDSHKFITEWDALVDDIYNVKFQQIVSNNYHGRCAISGLELPRVLVGCHILPVSENDDSCLDINNGLYLNLTVAKAYIDGLVGIDSNYVIHLSDQLKNHQFDSGFSQYFGRYEGKKLLVNDVIIKPNPLYLEWHMDSVFNQ